MTTMLFGRVRDLLLLVHGADNPTDEDWVPYVDFVRAAQSSATPVTALLVTTHGGAPNAGQRKAILDAAGARTAITCVCTNSLLARGVLTAISWLHKDPMYALRLEEIDRALELLRVPREQWPDAKSALAALEQRLMRASGPAGKRAQP